MHWCAKHRIDSTSLFVNRSNVKHIQSFSKKGKIWAIDFFFYILHLSIAGSLVFVIQCNKKENTLFCFAIHTECVHVYTITVTTINKTYKHIQCKQSKANSTKLDGFVNTASVCEAAFSIFMSLWCQRSMAYIRA